MHQKFPSKQNNRKKLECMCSLHFSTRHYANDKALLPQQASPFTYKRKFGSALINDQPIQKHHKIPYPSGDKGIQHLQKMTAKHYARKPK